MILLCLFILFQGTSSEPYDQLNQVESLIAKEIRQKAPEFSVHPADPIRGFLSAPTEAIIVIPLRHRSSWPHSDWRDPIKENPDWQLVTSAKTRLEDIEAALTSLKLKQKKSQVLASAAFSQLAQKLSQIGITLGENHPQFQQITLFLEIRQGRFAFAQNRPTTQIARIHFSRPAGQSTLEAEVSFHVRAEQPPHDLPF
jgi:hypothetical protein